MVQRLRGYQGEGIEGRVHGVWGRVQCNQLLPGSQRRRQQRWQAEDQRRSTCTDEMWTSPLGPARDKNRQPSLYLLTDKRTIVCALCREIQTLRLISLSSIKNCYNDKSRLLQASFSFKFNSANSFIAIVLQNIFKVTYQS